MDLFIWQNFQEITNPKGIPAKITSASMTKENWLTTTENSLQITSKKSGVTKPLKWSGSVISISCNFSFTLLLTVSGEVWAFGSDESRSGLFGVENLFHSETPQKINFYSSIIMKIAVAQSHAACIDQEGRLYSWGSGQEGQLGDKRLTHSRPAQVPSFFKAVDVSCGVKSTTVCSEAGFLFIFGKKNNCSNCRKSSVFPVTLKALTDDFVVKSLAVGEETLVVNDRGEVKIIASCFCVQSIGNKGKVAEFCCFDKGAVCLAHDKKTVHVFRKELKGWKCESFSAVSGECEKLVSSNEKNIGIVGRGLARGFKKITGGQSEDASLSTNDRVSFEEIAQTCGFKGKIESVNQDELFLRVEKVYLRICFRVFKLLKNCPKKKINSLVVLSNRFLNKSVGQFWNNWKFYTIGFSRAKVLFEKKMKILQGRAFFKVMMKVVSPVVKKRFSWIFKKVDRKYLAVSCVKGFLVLDRLTNRKNEMRVYRTYLKLRKLNTGLKSKNPLFDPKYKIEIVPPLDDKDHEKSPLTSHSFLSENDATLSKFFFSNNETSAISSSNIKLSNSMKVTSSTSSPLIDPLSPTSDFSPNLTSPKEDLNFSSLRKQMSKKIPERQAPNIKLGSLTDRSAPKSPAAQKRQPEKKKNLTGKDAESPKILTKMSFDSIFSKRQSAGGLQKDEAFEIRKKRLKILINRVISKRFSEVMKRISSVNSGSKSVGFCGSPNSYNLSGSWKNKLYALGFNKITKPMSGLIKKSLRVGFFYIKKVVR